MEFLGHGRKEESYCSKSIFEAEKNDRVGDGETTGNFGILSFRIVFFALTSFLPFPFCRVSPRISKYPLG